MFHDAFHGGSSSLHSAQLLGFMNALRTGDPVIDLLVAMVLPLLLQRFFALAPTLWTWLVRFFQKRTNLGTICTRRIVQSTPGGGGGRGDPYGVVPPSQPSDADVMNFHLIRAVKLYIHSECELRLADAAWELTPLQAGNNNPNHGGGRNAPQSLAETLESCALVERPLPHQWHTLHQKSNGEADCSAFSAAPSTEDGLEKGAIQIMIVDLVGNNNNNGGNNQNDNSERQAKQQVRQTSTEIQLRTKAGKQALDAFLQKAYTWYLQELKRRENEQRFMFDLGGSGNRRGGDAFYTAYKLGDEKTFETLFSHECQDLRRIIDTFQNKAGKYAVKGFPYKLGLLLSGQPGTGKTSLIKALAHYTGRHIVNINLSRIRSNEELMACFFRSNYVITQPTQQTLKLGFNQVIFVLEDVDASSDVVMDRKLLQAKKKKQAKEKAAALAKATQLPGPGTNPPPFGNSRPRSGPLPAMDELNLSGLLNVLDGVVETPGRIVIMTTNHPEMLDPALIRPGRIDKQLTLTCMKANCVSAMLAHYYQTELTPQHKQRVTKVITQGGLQITPAQVEQLAMELHLLEDFIDALEQRLQQQDSTPPESSDDDDDDENDDGEDEAAVAAVDMMPYVGAQPNPADMNPETHTKMDLLMMAYDDAYGDY